MLLFICTSVFNESAVNEFIILFTQASIFLVSQFEYLMEYIVKMVSLNREPGNRNSTNVFWISYNYKIKKE